MAPGSVVLTSLVSEDLKSEFCCFILSLWCLRNFCFFICFFRMFQEYSYYFLASCPSDLCKNEFLPSSSLIITAASSPSSVSLFRIFVLSSVVELSPWHARHCAVSFRSSLSDIFVLFSVVELCLWNNWPSAVSSLYSLCDIFVLSLVVEPCVWDGSFLFLLIYLSLSKLLIVPSLPHLPYFLLDLE